MRGLLITTIVFFSTPLHAEEKFFIDGNTIVYKTDTSEYSEGITSEDVTKFS